MNNFKRPLISVVFTSYNHRNFLRQAIESIINQTYHPFEVIVVDDCSTDGSQDILREYADNPAIQLNLLEKNTGSYVKASNYGTRFAKGEYILFAQCDDFADPRQMELMIDAFNANPSVGVVFSRSNMVNEKGEVYGNDFTNRERRFRELCRRNTVISRLQMSDFLSYSCVIPNLSAALIKKEVYDDVNGLSENYIVASDWAFWLDVAVRSDFFYISDCLNNFRQHETTIRSRIKIEKQILEIHEIFYKVISKYNLKGAAKWKMRVGAGCVWFAYQIFRFKPNFKIMVSVCKSTFKYEKLNLFFLFLGACKYCREFLYLKMKM